MNCFSAIIDQHLIDQDYQCRSPYLVINEALFLLLMDFSN